MSEDRPGILDGAVHPAEQTKLFGHAEAQDFLTYLHSDAARAVFEQQGFIVLPPNG